MTDENERYESFYDLGNTRPEEAVRLRAERLAKQKIPVDHAPHPTAHVRDYSSDRDDDPRLTMDEVREPRPVVDPATRLAVRAAMAEISDQRITDLANGDEVYAAALRRARDEKRARRPNGSNIA